MGQSSRDCLRLGRIGFLNVLPIYYPLETGVIAHPFTVVSGAPSYLNELMARGDLDVSVVSSIEYARHPDRYFIMPDLSISCCGAVKSVILFSRVPISALAGQAVLASTQSHTSVALLKVLFSIQRGMEIQCVPGQCTEALARGERPTAFVAIGDEALKLRGREDYPYRLDLGGEWHAWTGLPFVFALWVVQRKSIERWNGHMETAMETLRSAKNWGRANLDRICSEAVQAGVLSYEELRDYYECLGFDLNSGERRGLELFFQLLLQIGEISEIPSLEIYSSLAHVA